MLLVYCTGLIAVCTGLLVICTVLTTQNYLMLRALSDSPPGKHEGERAAPVRRTRGEGSVPTETFDDGEWTGPVIPYTPAAQPRR